MWMGKSERGINTNITMRLYRNDEVPMFCVLFHLLVHIGMMGLREGMALFPCKAYHKNPSVATCKSISKKELKDELDRHFRTATERMGPFGIHSCKKARYVFLIFCL
jgi:hypothetical protein